MKLGLEIFNEDDAITVSTWRYDGIYSIYNYPEYERAKALNWAITLKEKRAKEFLKVINEYGEFIGYVRIQDMEGYLLLGIGLNPVFCGRGIGYSLLKLIQNTYERDIELEVRSFNERAIRCYIKSGFREVSRYTKETPIGHGEFIKMKFEFLK